MKKKTKKQELATGPHFLLDLAYLFVGNKGKNST